MWRSLTSFSYKAVTTFQSKGWGKVQLHPTVRARVFFGEMLEGLLLHPFSYTKRESLFILAPLLPEVWCVHLGR